MPASLFGRATRFPVSAGENRLTEITAAVLERDPRLAVAFATALVQEASRTAASAAQRDIRRAGAWLTARTRDAEVHVETQVARASGSERGIVDLQLRLTTEPIRRDRDLLIWVEIKHGADISGKQLDAYRRLVWREPAAVHLVIVLAPRQSPPTQSLVPEDVPVLFWQDVVSACLRALEPRRRGTEALLVDEFMAYLKEQNLMPPKPLTTEFALALAVRQATRQTVVALLEHVHGQVKERYSDEGCRGGSRQPQYGTSFWAKHTIRPSNDVWRGGWLEWGLRHDHSHPESRDAYAFVAGMTFHKNKNPLASEAHAEWAADRLADGFLSVVHEFPRLWSYRYPEQLLVATGLQDQADLLSDWVLERFDALVQHPPPVTPATGIPV